MNCKQIEPLLHLYRKGELGDTEQKTVRDHLEKCDACQELYHELRSMDAEISPLRENDPAPRNAQALTHRIMQQVDAEEERGHHSGQPHRSVSILSRLTLPGARYAMSFALIAIVSLFTIQEFFILHKISALEARLEYNEHRSAAEATLSGYSNADDQILTPVEMEILEKWVVIRRSRVGALISEIEALEAENRALRQILEERYPVLVDIIDSRGLTESELDRMLDNRAELLNTLRKL